MIIRVRAQLADCDTKLARHRTALEAGADPKIITGRIAEVEAERRRLLAIRHQPAPKPTTLGLRLLDISGVVRRACGGIVIAHTEYHGHRAGGHHHQRRR